MDLVGLPYDVFVLLGVMSDFGDCDATRDVVTTGCFACGNWKRSPYMSYKFSVILIQLNIPENSRRSLTSNKVMTFPFLWETSTSPSTLRTLSILAKTSPWLTERTVSLSLKYFWAHSRASLLTQCQLLGLWRTIVVVCINLEL